MSTKKWICSSQDLSWIGKGTYGQVFCARRGSTSFALKTPYSEKELQYLQMCQGHENIVRCYGTCITEDRSSTYLVLEYLWKTLDSYRAMFCEPTLTPSMAHQLLSGLTHIHSLGLVHGDIRPDNLMVNQHGALKIIDFGSACPMQEHMHTPQNVRYQAVELCETKEVVVALPIHDIYTAAAVLCEITYGKTPYDRDYKPRSDTTPLGELLASMLNPDPSQRPTAQEALQHPYFTCLS
jgi:serine/threonine protein kinase